MIGRGRHPTPLVDGAPGRTDPCAAHRGPVQRAPLWLDGGVSAPDDEGSSVLSARQHRGARASLRYLPAVRDFLQIDGLTRAQLELLLDATAANLPHAEGRQPAKTTLEGKVVANVFFEDSTRTRCSFETAVHRLGGEVFTVSAAGSSASKGESLIDTALNVEAMGVAVMVVRCAISGGAGMVARALRIPVINAGDGRHAHPTQGLLDVATLREALGELDGTCVAIVGDVANSRVARSTAQALCLLGARVRLVGPPTLVPRAMESLVRESGRISISHDLDEALAGVDAVIMLRIQLERAAGSAISSDYRILYGLTQARIRRLPPHAVVLHPGPMNRGVEIDDSVADDPGRSRILRQVTLGVASRMAVLEHAVVE
ncbi:MAG: aspartate carbamoyltransferase [Planctomycetota bacterium]